MITKNIHPTHGIEDTFAVSEHPNRLNVNSYVVSVGVEIEKG